MRQGASSGALRHLGVPLPGSGIKIVPRAQLHLSEEQIALGEVFIPAHAISYQSCERY